MKKKFYKTTITFEVLSEDPIPDDLEMTDIARETIEGSYSGRTIKFDEKVLTGKQMAKALIKQSSSPEFFRIDKDGNSID